MQGLDWATLLPILKTLSVPLLLYVGKFLKRADWFNNQAIPWAILVLNGAGWVLMQLGVAHLSGSTWIQAPAGLGMGSVAVPLYATLAFAVPGWLGSAAGTVFSVLVEQFFLNYSHKGIKYRTLFKGAESANIIPPGQAKILRQRSQW